MALIRAEGAANDERAHARATQQAVHDEVCRIAAQTALSIRRDGGAAGRLGLNARKLPLLKAEACVYCAALCCAAGGGRESLAH